MLNFKKITSQSNAKIKWLKKLSQKKYRRQNNEFTVENLTTIYDALKSGHGFRDLFVTKGFLNKNKQMYTDPRVTNNSNNNNSYLYTYIYIYI